MISVNFPYSRIASLFISMDNVSDSDAVADRLHKQREARKKRILENAKSRLDKLKNTQTR